MEPDIDRKKPENRGQLLAEFEKRLFREARKRHEINIHDLYVSRIQDLMYRLSLETLTQLRGQLGQNGLYLSIFDDGI